jgi:hypothetical protein
MQVAVYPYSGIYDPIGFARRNELLEAKPVNPLPENAMSNESGDAGRDGYTVYSRANRYNGERTISQVTPEFEGPKMNGD